MDLSDIPDVPHSRVAYADGYGNLKTTIKSEDLNLPSGSVARVGIGDVEREAYVSDGSFEVEEGKLALAPGSSGWTYAAGEETVWMELFLRGGSAWEEFGRPLVGSEVRIEA
jgi:S-adenosylmethionine hydrolase